MNIGFDETKYINLQTQKILERVDGFNDKLYIEFGGKLFDDYHASRVLTGFQPDTKVKILNNIKHNMEIVFCVSAMDIEKDRIRGDSNLTYNYETLRCVDELRKYGFEINNIIITLFEGQEKAIKFADYLTNARKENVMFFQKTKNYGTDKIDSVVSDEGLGANPFIQTDKPIVVVNAPGAATGKLGVCLCQLYN